MFIMIYIMISGRDKPTPPALRFAKNFDLIYFLKGALERIKET